VSNKINIAIVITLVDDVLESTFNLLEYFDTKHQIRFIKESQFLPHITLCTREIEQNSLDSIHGTITKLCKEYKTFKIQTNGLGIFLQDQINIHIRWQASKELCCFKDSLESKLDEPWFKSNDFNEKNSWLAKTSIAYKDVSYTEFSKIDFDTIKIKNVDMQVKEISIIKFEIGKKETELANFSLNEEKTNNE